MNRSLKIKDFLQAKETVLSNLILQYYKKIGLTEEELVLYLELLRFQQLNNDFPDLKIIAEEMGLSSDHIFKLLEQLVMKKVVAIDTVESSSGKSYDSYDLTLIYQQIDQLIDQTKYRTKEEAEQLEVKKVYQEIEQEFGRPLSPIEMETISYWINDDRYAIDLIRLALKEAVLNQAYNLKYMDRILLAWERKNLRSKEQVLASQQRRKEAIVEKETASSQTSKTPLTKVPLDNWLYAKKTKKD